MSEGRKVNRDEHIFTSATLSSIVQEAVDFFKNTEILPLPPEERFIGGGVYALYYNGDFEHYQNLVHRDAGEYKIPVYVGKAVPPGWRTARMESSNSADLYKRLREHSKSIIQANNLNLEDFRCRFMILDGTEGDLVVPVEAGLIRHFVPLWNNLVDGFGNHDPGSGRYDQAKSEWDVLHEGRYWANNLRGEHPRLENIIEKLRNY